MAKKDKKNKKKKASKQSSSTLNYQTLLSDFENERAQLADYLPKPFLMEVNGDTAYKLQEVMQSLELQLQKEMKDIQKFNLHKPRENLPDEYSQFISQAQWKTVVKPNYDLLTEYYTYNLTPNNATAEQHFLLASISLKLADFFYEIYSYQKALKFADHAVKSLSSVISIATANKSTSQDKLTQYQQKYHEACLIFFRVANAVGYQTEDGHTIATQPYIKAVLHAYHYFETQQMYLQQAIAAARLNEFYIREAGLCLSDYEDDKANKNALTQARDAVYKAYHFATSAYTLFATNFPTTDIAIQHTILDLLSIANHSSILVKAQLEIEVAANEEINISKYHSLLSLYSKLAEYIKLAENCLYIIRSKSPNEQYKLFYDKPLKEINTFCEKIQKLYNMFKKIFISFKKSNNNSNDNTKHDLSSTNNSGKEELLPYQNRFKFEFNLTELSPINSEPLNLSKFLAKKIARIKSKNQQVNEYNYIQLLANHFLLNYYLSNQNLLLSQSSTGKLISDNNDNLSDKSLKENLIEMQKYIADKKLIPAFFAIEDIAEQGSNYIENNDYILGLALLLLAQCFCQKTENPGLYAHITYEIAAAHNKIANQHAAKVDLIDCFAQKKKDISDELVNLALARQHYHACAISCQEIIQLCKTEDSQIKADKNNNRELLDIISDRAKILQESSNIKISRLYYQYYMYKKNKNEIKQSLINTGAWYKPKTDEKSEINETALIKACEIGLEKSKECLKQIHQMVQETFSEKTNNDGSTIFDEKIIAQAPSTVDKQNSFFKDFTHGSLSQPTNSQRVIAQNLQSLSM